MEMGAVSVAHAVMAAGTAATATTCVVGRVRRASLTALDEAARSGANLMPRIADCVRNDATVGEIVGTLKNTFGEHRDQGF